MRLGLEILKLMQIQNSYVCNYFFWSWKIEELPTNKQWNTKFVLKLTENVNHSLVHALESLPPSLPLPHLSWFLPVLFSKNNSQLSTKKNLAIHLVFGFCSISRINILDKTKPSRFPAELLKRVIPRQQQIIKSYRHHADQ